MRTLKIVVVSKCLPYLAGPAVFAFEEAKALVQIGHDVHFVTYESYPHGTTIPDLDPAVLRNSGIKFHLVQEPTSNKVIGSQIAIAMLSEVLNIAWSSSQKPDFLRAHYAIPHGLIAVTAGKLLEIPSVVSLQGSDVVTLARMDGFREASTAVFQNADLLTPVARVLYEQVDELTQGKHASMWVMPSPVDTERFHPKGSLPIPNGVRIIYTGRLHDIKAVDVLIRGFEIAQRQMGNLPMSLTVAGVGPELPSLKQLTTNLGLEGSITFVEGAYSGLPELYRNHNVFATASRSTEEGMPFSVVEALASGLAVVATPVGDIPEHLKQWENCLYAKLADPDSLAIAFLTLAKRTDLIANIGIRNRTLAEQKFSMKEHCKRLTRLIIEPSYVSSY